LRNDKEIIYEIYGNVMEVVEKIRMNEEIAM